ncbi:MAG: NPCBM/NEW2 domain-containing protein [Clostridia bacterium]|nr:NPCBM/NEW2 domain-containing protein [Clostridia bacterium]
MKKTMTKLLAVTLCAGTMLPFASGFASSAGAAAQKEENQTVESRKTPLMGWASWNAYRTLISDEIILSQADKLVELGLADLGYTFVNVDDGWQNGRDENELVNINTERFPKGMADLAAEIHARGLQAGIYTDAGASTCGLEGDNEYNNDDVGLLGHEEADLYRYLVEWDYDFIKVDWCGGRRLGLRFEDRYPMIGRIIKQIEAETGKDKIFNVCCWQFPGEWVVDVADSWRTGGDITNTFESVLYQIDSIKSLAKYNGPGHVNDLDMMQVGNGMTYEEDKSHFAMWCMMSTPLMLGMDLNCISDETLSIISNKELIAINQDPACIQATVAKTYGSVEAWTKDLGQANSGKKAIALLNRENKPVTVTVSFEELGLADVTAIRDLWAHQDLSTDGVYQVTIPAHGTVMLTAEGTPLAAPDMDDLLTPDGSAPMATMEIAPKPSSVNLTKLGSHDWVHFASTSTKMEGGAGEISLTYDGAYVSYGNAAATYRWSNGDSEPKNGTSTSGIGVANVGAYMMIATPCDENVRRLNVAVGSFSADMEIELIVGGIVFDSVTIPGGNEQKVDKLVTLTYSSDKPTTAYLRWKVVSKLGNVESVNVEGVALAIEVRSDALYSPSLAYGDEGVTASVGLTAATKASRLHWALKDEEGKLVTLRTDAIKAGEKLQKLEAPLDLPVGFRGTLQLYLWDENNLPLTPMQEIPVNAAALSGYNVGALTAKQLIRDGAILLDVRTASEYESGHLEGALNLEYTKIAEEIDNLIADKDQTILVYCSAAKRSAQALDTLLRLGYTKVYNLGSMANYYAEPMITFTTDTCRVITMGEPVQVSYTASFYDSPEIYVSAGKDSTLEDAVLLSQFRVPESTHYYLTLKAYLVQGGVCYAETEKEFIYWSEDTVDTFATDLPWSEATVGWGSIHKDLSVEGNPLTLAGKVFSHGIGTHATSGITMGIPSGAKKFLAVAGCDLEKSGGFTMMFYVYIDGKLADHSSLIKIGQHYVFDVDIPEGAKEIRLYAYESRTDGMDSDHADWTVAGFVNDPTRG